MTLIEVVFAVVIMSGVMVSLSNFSRRFQQLSSQTAAMSVASDLAMARIELIRGFRPYTSIVSTYHGTSETSAGSSSPSMANFPGFTRTTSAVRTTSGGRDFVTVTVTVTGTRNQLSTPVRKTTIIASF